MGTTQGADAPDNQMPPGVGGLTVVRAVLDLPCLESVGAA
jgi:hypothetical protein